MRVVLQRVERASVSVDGEVVGRIGPGLLALVGVAAADTPDIVSRLAAKTLALRLFADGERPFERSLVQVGGELLCVSQFTLLGDVRKGNRPSWTAAAPPELAEPLVDHFGAVVAAGGVPVAYGRFGANMRVEIVNDGPVTMVLDSGELSRPRRGSAA